MKNRVSGLLMETGVEYNSNGCTGSGDYRAIRQWKQELEPYSESANGIIEGFLGGNVEVIYFEGEMVVVVYHLSLPETYPVAVPLGFISTDKEVVSAIGGILQAYVQGVSGYDARMTAVRSRPPAQTERTCATISVW